MTALKTLNILTTLGHYVRTPTVEMLTHIFSIVRSPAVVKNKLLKHNAMLNFANLVHKLCLCTARTSHYPAHVFGQPCTETTAEITNTFLPYALYFYLLSEKKFIFTISQIYDQRAQDDHRP